MKIPAKAGIVWSSEGPLPYFDSLFVQALYFLAQGIVDIGTTRLAMLFKIPFGKEAGAILGRTPAPRC
jgi:hypothetical protein